MTKKSTQFGNTVSQKSDEPLRVDEKVAQEVGFGSRDTLRKAEYIVQNADEDLIKSLDEGKLSINKAYITLKQQKELLEKQLRIEKNKKPENHL